MDILDLSVSELIALVNMTLDGAYPEVLVHGELTQANPWRNQLVFFSLKDKTSVVECMMPLVNFPKNVEVGMQVQISAKPKLTQKGRFSLTAKYIRPLGEGALNRAFEILKTKLSAEGVFDEDRKRPIPDYPETIGIITARKSAAAADMLKRLEERWPLAIIILADTQVQGERAPEMIDRQIQRLNQRPIDVLIVARGGGSAEDLASFNDESVIRAVATSRTPTVVGIGHESDTCLAELAADVRASTPTHAAVLATPSRDDVLYELEQSRDAVFDSLQFQLDSHREVLQRAIQKLPHLIPINELNQRVSHLKKQIIYASRQFTTSRADVLGHFERELRLLDPKRSLARGFALVSQGGQFVESIGSINKSQNISVELSDGIINAEIINVTKNS
ncbi:exodeoxyribonuclease VII large subunit [Candidatus Saccharibacteria bacterium]|nr:exodeoxyribonuclease VII large subunit [Candidatus Saccharibacteria bacterium]